MSKKSAGLALACGLLIVCGCAGKKDDGPPTYRITGTVKFEDGVPLPDGTIMFTAADGKSNPASAEIKDGKFETFATEGTKNVSVSCLVVTGTETINVPTLEPGKGPTVEIKEDLVSREFNELSKETYDVKPIEQNTYDLVVKRADPSQRPLSQPF